VYSTFEIRRSTPNLFLTWQKCDHASECEEEEEEYIYKCIYVQKLNQTVLELYFRAVKIFVLPSTGFEPTVHVYIYIHLYIIQTSRSKWHPYNISVPLDLKVTLKDTRLILNITYVWKLNQTVLELDFRAVKFLFFPRRGRI
jgi:hypothetical protein